ncbi:MAG: COX15/CtaA family protein [Polyangiaceae bacterium]
MSAAVREPYRWWVIRWLTLLCALVVSMVVVGGITRLTGSGLSIVEWRPVTGALPPLSERAWEEAFEAYRASPQYRLVNAGMSLSAFKHIFFWEYVHRLLGRFIGIAFVAPWLFFVSKRALSRALMLKLLVGLGLGGLQGALGWFMVASGLVDVPHVSHYRLAAHLSLALVVLGYLFALRMDLGGPGAGAERRARVALRATLVLIAVQIVYGAFTAGLHAGFGYNTFPTMHGSWLPPGGLALEPAWRNLVENTATVQFLHRVFGTLVVASVGVVIALTRGAAPAVRRTVHWLAAATALQFALGVATLVFVVPIPLAVAHQLGACMLFLVVLRADHEARPG